MVYKEVETKQTNVKKETSKSCSKENYIDDINRLDNNITTLERDYVLFKNDINNNLKNLTENVILLTKNIDKLYEIEKKLLEQSHNDKLQEEKINNIEKTHNEKIVNIEKKIDWITKLFISTIFVIGLNFIYNVNDKKDDEKNIVYVEKSDVKTK